MTASKGKGKKLSPSQSWYVTLRERMLTDALKRYEEARWRHENDPEFREHVILDGDSSKWNDPVRQQAILKLRFGTGSLTAEELLRVPPDNQAAAREVRKRTLAEVGKLFGLTRERIRQLINKEAARAKFRW